MPLQSEIDILITKLVEVQECLNREYKTIPRDITNGTQYELMLTTMHNEISNFLLRLRVRESNKQKN